MTGRDDVNASLAMTTLTYWQEATNTVPRSEKVRTAYLKRIRQRLEDGFSVAELCRCVDAAMADKFYLENRYHKQPEVFWKNAARVESLLQRQKPAPPKRAVAEPMPPDELEAARKERDEWLARARR